MKYTTTNYESLSLSKQQFVALLLKHEALKFGNFTLKSGRQSPYFFNLGAFNSGASLSLLGHYYAKIIQEHHLQFNVLFGPAYKGIPLVTTTSISLATEFNTDVPYCFNRKMKKTYADGGDLVGTPLFGKVLMVDDVITAGTTVRETISIMNQYQATLSGIIIAFDRQEKSQENSDCTAVQEVIDHYKIPVYSIITLQDVIHYLEKDATLQCHLTDIIAYQSIYGNIPPS